MFFIGTIFLNNFSVFASKKILETVTSAWLTHSLKFMGNPTVEFKLFYLPKNHSGIYCKKITCRTFNIFTLLAYTFSVLFTVYLFHSELLYYFVSIFFVNRHKKYFFDKYRKRL